MRDERSVLSEYFRCPNEFETGRVASDLGAVQHFDFGHDTHCYGRLAPQNGASHTNHDGMVSVSPAPGGELPFDPGEVVENLRRERYMSATTQGSGLLGKVVRSVYYAARPLLPVSTRKHLQRLHLRGWDKLSFPRWPVDRTVDRIHERLLNLSLRAAGQKETPFIWFWPDGMQSCLAMTHDVETTAGRDFCSTLMDVNDSFAIKSAFQVVPEERYSVPLEFLESVRSRGFEVNVHDLNHDGRLYSDREEFLRRARRINQYAREYGARGFRSGVLYRNADWYDVFEFSYDMSIPNVGHLDPQRGGCCTLMPYFIGDILELPVTTIQDYSLFNILCDYSIDIWKRQIELITAHGGFASFIVHPDYIISNRARGVYKALLAHLAQQRADRRAWIALPNEVDQWWRARRNMTLVRRNGSWCVEGEDKERARVAYAAVSGDTVTYSFAPGGVQ